LGEIQGFLRQAAFSHETGRHRDAVVNPEEPAYLPYRIPSPSHPCLLPVRHRDQRNPGEIPANDRLQKIRQQETDPPAILEFIADQQLLNLATVFEQ
jgi:hypothetical protein